MAAGRWLMAAFQEFWRENASEKALGSGRLDLTKPWDDKISTTDIPVDGKTIHLVRC